MGVAAVMLGVVLVAGGCGPRDVPADRPSVCPTSGCVVPTGGPVDDPAAEVVECERTGDKGPCSTLWPGTDDLCHWWYVELGSTLDDGTARDLGVWVLEDGEVCA